MAFTLGAFVAPPHSLFLFGHVTSQALSNRSGERVPLTAITEIGKIPILERGWREFGDLPASPESGAKIHF